MFRGYQARSSKFEGAGSTVEAIKAAALSSQQQLSVRQLVEEICQGLRDKDYLSEALAVLHFVWGRTRYMRDPRTVELVKSPHVMAEEILSGGTPQLDCDDMTALLLALLLASGARVDLITANFRKLRFQGVPQYSHIFIRVQEPRTGAWIVLDPVAGVLTAKMLKQIVEAKVWSVA